MNTAQLKSELAAALHNLKGAEAMCEMQLALNRKLQLENATLQALNGTGQFALVISGWEIPMEDGSCTVRRNRPSAPYYDEHPDELIPLYKVIFSGSACASKSVLAPD